MPKPEILFVYNVDLTPFALVSDFVHRITSPETYPCQLCDVTWDRFTMKRDWKQFIKTLPVKVSYEMRDRFRRKYPVWAETPLPAAFAVQPDGTLQRLLAAERINRAKTLEDMKRMVEKAVDAIMKA